MKSPCLLLKVVIPTTIRCKIDNTKVEQWAIAVFATDRCRNDKALPRKFIFVFLYSGIIRCKQLVQKRAEWFHFDLKQQDFFLEELLRRRNGICFIEFMKSIHVGLVLGSTSGFDHNCIMHSSAHYLKNTAITVSKKDPYTNLFSYVMPIWWNLTIDKVHSLYIRCYYNY